MSEQGQGRTDRLAAGLGAWVTDHPWLVVGLAILLVLGAGMGATNLEFSNNYRVFFSEENPDLVAFDDFQATYTKNDNILFVLQPANGSVFRPDVLATIEELTAEAWRIPYAIRVDSITNFQHSWADGDDLTVEDLVRDGAALSQEALDERRAVALAEPLLRSNLISPDARTTGINVTLQYPEESLTEVPAAVAVARELADTVRAEHPEMTVALSGLSMLNNAFAEAGQQDFMTLVPLMFAVLVLSMVLALRSTAGTVSTLVVVAFASVTALGIAGHLGIDLTPISAPAPVIILTLAIADSVHIIISTLLALRDGQGKRDAIVESLRVNLVPVAITSVTTIVGFLSLNFSDAPPFRDLGNITAIGIVAALVYSVTLLPALMTLLPLRPPRLQSTRRGLEGLLARYADWVTAHHRPVLLGAGVVAVALIAFVPAIDLNDEFVEYFDYRVPFRAEAEFGIENLNGIYQMEYSLESGTPGGINEPAYLADLERFTTWLREQPEVTHVYSYADVIKRLNKNMHGDDPAWHRMPEERDLAAQYLLLYELSLPFGLDLNDRISVDKSATRVTATVGVSSTIEQREFVDRTEQWLADNVPEPMQAKATGAAVMFSHISKRNIDGMLRGNVLAVILIAGIMMLALRSVGVGALSLIPNAVPILMTFGVWSLVVGQVGMASAIVSVTSLAIVVDDTVHLLAKYMRARREKGLERREAIRYAFQTVGRAVASTTVVLTIGFGVLALSTFRVNSEMGLLTGMSVVIALVVDFVMLPALLMIGTKTRTVGMEDSSHAYAKAS